MYENRQRNNSAPTILHTRNLTQHDESSRSIEIIKQSYILQESYSVLIKHINLYQRHSENSSCKSCAYHNYRGVFDPLVLRRVCGLTSS